VTALLLLVGFVLALAADHATPTTGQRETVDGDWRPVADGSVS
jgi:hypothetical protein